MYPPPPLHDHAFGPVETSRFCGTPTRHCQAPGCDWVQLADEDDWCDESIIEEHRPPMPLDVDDDAPRTLSGWTAGVLLGLN